VDLSTQLQQRCTTSGSRLTVRPVRDVKEKKIKNAYVEIIIIIMHIKLFICQIHFLAFLSCFNF